MDPPFINKVTKVTVRNILLIYFQELVLLKVPTISLSRLVIIDWFTTCITISLSRLVIIDWFTITISLTTVEVYTKAVKLHISVSDVCYNLGLLFTGVLKINNKETHNKANNLCSFRYNFVHYRYT